MLKIYHNPRCRKSRACLQYIRDKGLEVEIIEYFKTPFTEAELKKILMMLNKSPPEIIRTQEKIFRSQFKGKSFTDDEWIKIMLEHPKLIQRPIVVKKHKAVIANPPENINQLL
jgi:arsenate reductase